MSGPPAVPAGERDLAADAPDPVDAAGGGASAQVPAPATASGATAPPAPGDVPDVPDAPAAPVATGPGASSSPSPEQAVDTATAAEPPAEVDGAGFSWLLVDFAHRVPDVEHVLAVSSDGLLMAMSSDLDRARADTVAAIVAGLTSLVRGASGHLDGGEVRQAVVEMDAVFLLVMSVSEGAVLAVVADAACDVGLVGYEMALLAARAEAVLSPQLIDEARALLPTEGTAAAARPGS